MAISFPVCRVATSRDNADPTLASFGRTTRRHSSSSDQAAAFALTAANAAIRYRALRASSFADCAIWGWRSTASFRRPQTDEKALASRSLHEASE